MVKSQVTSHECEDQTDTGGGKTKAGQPKVEGKPSFPQQPHSGRPKIWGQGEAGWEDNYIPNFL